MYYVIYKVFHKHNKCFFLLCCLYNWRAGASQPSRTTGKIKIYIFIYLFISIRRCLSVPMYKLQYFICDTRGPTRNPGKNTTSTLRILQEYNVNFPYRRNLQIQCTYTCSCLWSHGYSGSQVEKGVPALLQKARRRGIGHRSMLFSRPRC